MNTTEELIDAYERALLQRDVLHAQITELLADILAYRLENKKLRELFSELSIPLPEGVN